VPSRIESHQVGAVLFVSSGLLAIGSYLLGDLLLAGGFPIALAGYTLWVVCGWFAVGGVIMTVTAGIARRLSGVMTFASTTLFLCAAALVVVGIVRLVRTAGAL